MVPRVGLYLRGAPLLCAVLVIALGTAPQPTQAGAQTGTQPGKKEDTGHAAASAGTVSADRVLLVVNDNSPLSRDIGEYYARRRAVPAQNICHIKASISEEVSRDDYDRQIARPLGTFLRKNGLQESIY